jgi:MFS family permease
MTAVSNWFRRRIGLAAGITTAGFGAGGLMILIMVPLIDMYGWRTTLTIMAFGLLLLLLPLSLIFRHKPEQYGLLSDGDKASTIESSMAYSQSGAIDVELTAGEVIRSSTFWRLAIAFTCHMAIVSAILTHVMPYLSSIGINRGTASFVAMSLPLLSIGGRIGMGILGDIYNKKYVAAIGLAATGLGTVVAGLASAWREWLLIPFAILFGIGYGGVIAMRASLGREFFGRTRFGTLFGLIVGINMIGVLVGPPLAGYVFDRWGSYENIWFLLAGFALIAIIAMLSIRTNNNSNFKVSSI